MKSSYFFRRTAVNRIRMPFAKEKTTGFAHRATAAKISRPDLRPTVTPGLVPLKKWDSSSKKVGPTVHVSTVPGRASRWKRWDLDGGWDVMALGVFWQGRHEDAPERGFYYFFDIENDYEELHNWNGDFREHLDHLLLLDPIS